MRSKITLKLQGRYRTVQQRLLLCVKFIKVLPPFCDIPHEETHFAVTVDLQTALAIRLISDFVIAQCMGFEFPASKLSYKLLKTIVALIKTKPTLRR